MTKLVHLGLGNFFRAHQAWYTDRANATSGTSAGDGRAWGYTAFGSRSARLAEAMSANGNEYTLIERGAEGDTEETIGVVTASVAGGDEAAWVASIRDPETAVITVTVSEAGYGLSPGSAPHRLATALAGRAAAGGPPIAIMSCDNLSDNGGALRGLVLRAAERLDPALPGWIVGNASFPSTMVDRITPASANPVRVVTEPYSDWVIAGDFPSGRPDWDRVGVSFVSDIRPYEQRKLWLLNAAHTALAYLGLLRGHATIAEAFHDVQLRAAVEQLWSDVRPLLDLPRDEIERTLAALRERFANPRIEHLLAQVALQGNEKLRQRQVAIQRARREHGLPPSAACDAVIAAFHEVEKRGITRVD